MKSLRGSASRADVEWLGGTYRLPNKLREGGVLIEPDVVLWLELPRGVIVCSKIVDSRVPLAFEEILSETMKNPGEGQPRRPARIRVPTTQLADALRDVDATVVVAPVPELDALFTELVAATAPPPALTSYLANGAVSPDLVRTFFSISATFFRAAPWHYVSEDQILRVDIPEFQVEDACLSVIGGAGESHGLLLFRSFDAYLAFATVRPPAGEALPGARPHGETSLLSLSFDPKKYMPAEMLREIKKYRWEVAGAKGYPALLAFDAESIPQPLTDRLYRIMTACTNAFLAFFALHHELFEEDDAALVSESFVGPDGVSVTLTTASGEEPLDDDFGELIDFEDRPPAVNVRARQEVGRNDPCPCGSGKKYKKCHLDADRTSN